MAALSSLSLQDALDRMARGDTLIVDVREAYHRTSWSIGGAFHLPLGRLLAEPERVPRDRAVVTVGRDARESEFAARYLREQGWEAFSMADAATPR